MDKYRSVAEGSVLGFSEEEEKPTAEEMKFKWEVACVVQANVAVKFHIVSSKR
jgi:hypothetical protein